MSSLKELARQIPALPFMYRWLRGRIARARHPAKAPQELFTEIYRSNAWGGASSVSGTGSDAQQTRTVVKELQALCRELGITTMLDIPCGDFHWMKNVDLSKVDYLGADIVKELVDANRTKYAAPGVRFQHLNLIDDPLPRADLIFCRDCLVHLSFSDIFAALDNICRSRSEYLLTTTFTDRTHNEDIATGRWRVLNLRQAPFMFPDPVQTIVEECTEDDGIYGDKALGLWRVNDLRNSLARCLR